MVNIIGGTGSFLLLITHKKNNLTSNCFSSQYQIKHLHRELVPHHVNVAGLFLSVFQHVTANPYLYDRGFIPTWQFYRNMGAWCYFLHMWGARLIWNNGPSTGLFNAFNSVGDRTGLLWESGTLSVFYIRLKASFVFPLHQQYSTSCYG